ncbi:VWA domain-containing protein [Candidatus Parabeggiatoa sp. HSG14]|uniref:vWA domain-containing protein n=1 Tax=Candidatus Parabeggiatoa sp. HSG14 TaxID=3055593 RepID=UPI0025A6CFB3|nr:VWA domain-containing protein [Thiotrichales bacterium HSG14]
MFTFQWPWLALLLPLPLLIWRFWPAQLRAANNLPRLRLATTVRVQQAFAQLDFSNVSRRQWWRWFLLALCWVALVGALMYPQILDKHIEVSQTGYDLMLAVDLSGSMETADFFTRQQRITRLSAVKSVLEPFIERRVGDRIGLILFADHAYLQAPLTLDNAAVQSLLQKSVIGMAGRETAIGEAIGLAVKKLRKRPEDSRVLILLTDGDNTAGVLEPLKAAQLAKQYNIRIYTIGVGSKGTMFQRGLNERPLKEIAKLTNGAYFPASNLRALANVYDHIDKTLQRTEAESRIYVQRTPLYQWPLFVAMLTLLVLQLLRIYIKDVPN